MPDSFILRRYKSLTAFAHQMLLHHALDGKTLARLAGANYQTMMSELSQQRGHKWGADNILPFSDALDSDALVEWLAEQRHGVFVRVPAVSGNLRSAEGQCIRTIKEFGDVAQSVGQALQDGRLSPRELEKTRKEIWESIQAHLLLLRILELECEEEEV